MSRTRVVWMVLAVSLVPGVAAGQAGGVPAGASTAPPPAPPAPGPSGLPGPAPVGADPIPGMSLQEALAYARGHQPAVRAALARVGVAEAEARATRAQWLPYLGATAQLIGGTANNTTASYFSGGGVDLPRIGGTPVRSSGGTQPYASSVAAIGVTQEVFDFGRVAAQAAVADASTSLQRLGAEAESLLVALGVEESFYAVNAARGVLKASEDAYQRSLVHRDLARAGVAAGLRAVVEQTRAEAEVARFEVGRVRALGGLVVAQAAFAAAVGLPEARLDALGEAPPAAAPPGLRAAIELAAQRDPLLRAAAEQVRAEAAVTESLAAQLRPNLLLSGSLSGREGGAAPATAADAAPHHGWVPDIPNWDVALVLRIPIFDWVLWKRVDASRQREQVRRAELDLVRQGQVAAVQRAWVSVDSARQALVALERAVDAARANHAQAEARYKGGLASIVELADAEALRTEAEIQLALGKFDLARQRAILGRLIVEAP